MGRRAHPQDGAGENRGSALWCLARGARGEKELKWGKMQRPDAKNKKAAQSISLDCRPSRYISYVRTREYLKIKPPDATYR